MVFEFSEPLVDLGEVGHLALVLLFDVLVLGRFSLVLNVLLRILDVCAHFSFFFIFINFGSNA